jgi:hypothetical protein
MDDKRLPLLALWVEVLRIVVHRKAMLRALNLDQPVFGPKLSHLRPGRFDGHKGVLGPVNDERRCGDLAKREVRLKPEHLVEERRGKRFQC